MNVRICKCHTAAVVRFEPEQLELQGSSWVTYAMVGNICSNDGAAGVDIVTRFFLHKCCLNCWVSNIILIPDFQHLQHVLCSQLVWLLREGGGEGGIMSLRGWRVSSNPNVEKCGLMILDFALLFCIYHLYFCFFTAEAYNLLTCVFISSYNKK